MSVTMRLGGDIRRLSRHMQKLSTLAMEDNNQTIAEMLRSSTRRRFREGKDPRGKEWPRSKRLADQKGRTLVDTARLRNSIRSRATDKLAEVGTNVIYAGRHQFGDKKPLVIRAKTARGLRFQVGRRWVNTKHVRVKLPQRAFLGISKNDMDEIRDIMDKSVMEAGR